MAINGDDITEQLLFKLLLRRGYWTILEKIAMEQATRELIAASEDDAILRARRVYDATQAGLAVIKIAIEQRSNIAAESDNVHYDT